jgi:hypothetical protein
MWIVSDGTNDMRILICWDDIMNWARIPIFAGKNYQAWFDPSSNYRPLNRIEMADLIIGISPNRYPFLKVLANAAILAITASILKTRSCWSGGYNWSLSEMRHSLIRKSRDQNDQDWANCCKFPTWFCTSSSDRFFNCLFFDGKPCITITNRQLQFKTGPTFSECRNWLFKAGRTLVTIEKS